MVLGSIVLPILRQKGDAQGDPGPGAGLVAGNGRSCAAIPCLDLSPHGSVAARATICAVLLRNWGQREHHLGGFSLFLKVWAGPPCRARPQDDKPPV